MKSKLNVVPWSGEEEEEIVAGLFKVDSATVAKIAEILTRVYHLNTPPIITEISRRPGRPIPEIATLTKLG